MVLIFNLEDACQYALQAEKRVLRYDARKPLFGKTISSSQGSFSSKREFSTNEVSRRNVWEPVKLTKENRFKAIPNPTLEGRVADLKSDALVVEKVGTLLILVLKEG